MGRPGVGDDGGSFSASGHDFGEHTASGHHVSSGGSDSSRPGIDSFGNSDSLFSIGSSGGRYRGRTTDDPFNMALPYSGLPQNRGRSRGGLGLDVGRVVRNVIRDEVRDTVRDVTRDVVRDATRGVRNRNRSSNSYGAPPLDSGMNMGSSHAGNGYREQPRTDYRDNVSGAYSAPTRNTAPRSSGGMIPPVNTGDTYGMNSRNGGGTYSVGSYKTKIGIIAAVMAVLVCLVLFIGLKGGSSASTIERTKLDSGIAYNTNVVVDELDFIEDTNKLSKGLQKFYDKTGVQPFLYFKSYDSKVALDSEKDSWAIKKFESDKATYKENSMLFVYFEDSDPNEVGYMTIVRGTQVPSVIDSEAEEIFWGNIDRYWSNADLTTTDLFIKVYQKTGDTIMKVSTTSKDLMKWLIIGIILIGGGTIAVVLVKEKNNREREEAAETERILNTNIDELRHSSDVDRYAD